MVALALSIGLALASSLGHEFGLLTLYPVVIGAAVLFGLEAGLLATGAGAVGAWILFLAPGGHALETGAQAILGIVAFLAMGALTSSLADSYHRAMERVESAERELDLLAGEHAKSGLIQNMQEGLAYHRMIFDDRGAPEDYVFIQVNGAFASLTGHRDLEGRRASEVLPEHLRAKPDLLRIFGEAARTGRPARFELEDATQDACYSVAVYSPHQDYFVTIFQNITDQRRAQARLEEERERLALTLSSVGDAVVATDVAGRITLLNGSAEELTGWSPREALGRPVQEVVNIIHEDTRHPAEVPVELVLREGALVGPTNHTLLLAGGRGERAIAGSIAPIRDARGQVAGVVMVFRDRGMERRAEKVVRTRLDLLEFAQTHTLLEVLQHTLDEVGRLIDSPVGFFHFVEADQQAVSLQAWSTRTLREFCRAEGAGRHYPIDMAGVWADAVRERRPVVHNAYGALPHRKGLPEGHATIERELVIPIIRDDQVVAIVGFGNKPTDYTPDDVELGTYLVDACWETTARKRAEEARDQLEIQLRQAQKLESIGRLAGGIAHDFNNLLTVILSCAGIAEESLRTGADGVLEDLREIRSAGERARELTRRLLTFARKQVASPVPLNVNLAIRSMESLLRRVLGADVAVQTDLQSGLWPVLFDPGLLEQVLLNLAVNARDAMPEGGTLVIQSRNASVPPGAKDRRPDDRPGEWVRFSVRDTGVGMSAETRAHLFEPFFTTKDLGKGTGLGLAMVHGIVKQAGGHIHVESAPGKGSTFEICLPRTHTEVPSTSAEKTGAAHRASQGVETVLVVECEPGVRALMARALRGAGYLVLEASDAAEALEACREEVSRIDLLVSDTLIPGMSGRGMAMEALRHRPELRVLFVSGYPGDDVHVHKEGEDLLHKPFSQAAFLSAVRALLDRRKA